MQHLRNVTGLIVGDSAFATASILISFVANPFCIDERFLADEPETFTETFFENNSETDNKWNKKSIYETITIFNTVDSLRKNIKCIW